MTSKVVTDFEKIVIIDFKKSCKVDFDNLFSGSRVFEVEVVFAV